MAQKYVIKNYSALLNSLIVMLKHFTVCVFVCMQYKNAQSICIFCMYIQFVT